MNPLTKIYWLRVALGIVAGLLCTAVSIATQSVTGTTILAQVGNINTLFNGIALALFLYLLTFYILKAKFASQVEKKSKIMTMGIFIYFFAWLISWILTLTLIIGPV